MPTVDVPAMGEQELQSCNRWQSWISWNIRWVQGIDTEAQFDEMVEYDYRVATDGLSDNLSAECMTVPLSGHREGSIEQCRIVVDAGDYSENPCRVPVIGNRIALHLLAVEMMALSLLEMTEAGVVKVSCSRSRP